MAMAHNVLITKALQRVRALNATVHAVCFGLGPEGGEHVIVNRMTEAVNYMEDDWINYIQRLIVVPPNQIEAVQNAIQHLGFAGQGS